MWFTFCYALSELSSLTPRSSNLLLKNKTSITGINIIIKKINIMENLTFYTDILKNNYHITDENEQKEYLDFCLNEVKENIISCCNNEHSTKNVITELFKRAMVKKWNELH